MLSTSRHRRRALDGHALRQ